MRRLLPYSVLSLKIVDIVMVLAEGTGVAENRTLLPWYVVREVSAIAGDSYRMDAKFAEDVKVR